MGLSPHRRKRKANLVYSVVLGSLYLFFNDCKTIYRGKFYSSEKPTSATILQEEGSTMLPSQQLHVQVVQQVGFILLTTPARCKT